MNKVIRKAIYLSLIGSTLVGCGDSNSETETNVNSAPVLENASFSINEDNVLNGLIKAADKDGDTIQFSLLSDTENGVIDFSTDGGFEYQPNENFNGKDSFTVSAQDSEGASVQNAYQIIINPINDAPTISQNRFEVGEDIELNDSITATDVEQDVLEFKLVEGPSKGTLTLNSDGSFNYLPDLNFFGDDGFTVKVNDGNAVSESVYFEIAVTAINDAPVVLPVEETTRFDEEVTFPLEMQDVDGDELSITIVEQPSQGSVEINNDKTLTYTPHIGAVGVDRFKVEVADQQLSTEGKITIDNNLAVKGHVEVDSYENVQVLITGEGHLDSIDLNEDGEYKVYGLLNGEYAIKVRKQGFKSSPAKIINIIETKTNQQASIQGSSTNLLDNLDFVLSDIDASNFTFHWEEDQSTAGYDYSAYVNEEVTVEFLDEQITVVDDSAANKLQHELNILLVDSDSGIWTQEHAYRISEVMQTIPQQERDPYNAQSLQASKWLISSEYIEDDIKITTEDGLRTVIISDAVFVNASPKMAKVDGKRGKFYSQRLHHALVRFVTDNGTNVEAYERILNERYGVSTIVPNYPELTFPTGNESAGRFQPFHAEEVVQIINMFEEMPKGMHKLPELKYLLRRLDGTPHPLYKEAPAVAWSDAGYIEFMESAFNTSSVEHMHRLIIHEKAHFLWANQFDEKLKEDWIALGGWYQDSSLKSGWATTNQTEFVSAYAHLKNPNEDMAESISYFIINPNKLKSRALTKYEFVRDRIMQGNIYISQIREDLTFQVYNLFPDYVFPGKIKRVDINVNGLPEEDKAVSIEIELHALDKELEGAKYAYLRVFSEIGTFKDIYLNPVDEEGNRLGNNELSTILKGEFSLSKYAKAGYWRTSQIVITDAVGNQRMEGANDFGWKLYVNNPLEDIIKPEYLENTAQLSKSISEREGQEVQIIHAKWQVEENSAIQAHNGCYASLNDEILSTYRVEEYGGFDENSKLCVVDFVMPHYMPSSKYSMNYIQMADIALNTRGVYFTNTEGGLRDEDINIDEPPQQIELITNNQDIERPELDLNDIQITAKPTNPDAPNGETEVTVTFKVRDNNSGYNIASLNLRDPQGINHQFYAYNDETYTLFPTHDVTEWTTYSRTVILPVGSAPGTWGLSEMTIYDRAGNFKGYDFTEIVHFDVVD